MSNICFGTRGLSRILDLAEAYGVRGIELGSGVDYEPQPEAMLRSRSDLCYRFHNYFPAPLHPFVLNLASPDAAERRKSMEMVRRAADLCHRFSVPYYSVHAGFRAVLDPCELGRKLKIHEPEDYEISWGRFTASLREFCAYADRLGVGIAVENNVLPAHNLNKDGGHPLLCVAPHEFVRLMKEVPVGVLLDLGHLRVTSRVLDYDPMEMLEACDSGILAFHVSDNDGITDQHAPPDKESWVWEVLAQFSKGRDVVIEAGPLREEEFAELADRVRRL